MSDRPAARPAREAAYARLTGIAVLLLAVAIQVASWGDLRTSWQQAWMDTLHRFSPRERTSTPAYIVLIDETAIAEYGQWPWPRDRMANLAYNVFANGGAAVVVFDILFAEPDRNAPAALAAKSRFLNPDLAAEIEALPDPDTVFADILGEGPSVLAVAGTRRLARPGRCRDNAPRAGFEIDAALLQHMPCYRERVGLLPVLAAEAAGQAVLSYPADPSGVIRRVPVIQRLGPDPFDGANPTAVSRYNRAPGAATEPFAALGIEALRIASGPAALQIDRTGSGGQAELGPYRFPVETDGGFWLHFGKVERRHYVPAAEVLAGEEDLSFLKDKIVFIAAAPRGTSDLRETPLEGGVLGVEIHLQMIEQIVDESFLRRPWYLSWVETLLLIATALVVMWMAPRRTMLTGVVAVVFWVAGMLALNVIAFRLGLLVDLLTPGAGLLMVAASVQTVGLVETNIARLRADRDLAVKQKDLAHEQAERQEDLRKLAEEQARSTRLEVELDAAASIQKSLLPKPDFRIEDRVDLACSIRPARFVGGDFYEHFMIDDRRLYFSVSDVSGKGGRASLFMAVSKSAWKSTVLLRPERLDRIHSAANDELAQDNAEVMFVTVIAGILDLEDLTLQYASAGHDTPLVFRDDGPPEQLPASTGPPAGILPGAEFPMAERQLRPGDRLCLFSDGVTEAMDTSNALFGLGRLFETLGRVPAGVSSRAVVTQIEDDVAAFVDGYEQSDDLTLMVLTILGPH